MMLIGPLQQAECADRSKVTSGRDPGEWISPSLPIGWRLISFHFFVNWETLDVEVGSRIWMVRLVDLESVSVAPKSMNRTLYDEFSNGPYLKYFEDLEKIFSVYGEKVSVIFLPEIPVSDIVDETEIWVGCRNSKGRFWVWTISLVQLKDAIQKHSGGPVRVGSKGLTYGTSAVECALSKTDAAFPGDADAIIVDENNYVRCLIEYKKHNVKGDMGDYLVDKFYPNPDRRKYQRLFALFSHYSSRQLSSISFVIFYYSTKKPVIRLQEIGRLKPENIEILRDSGDISAIDGQEKQTSDLVINWLGF